MFQVRLGSGDNDAAGIESSEPPYVLDNLAGFLEAGAIRDGVQNKEDVCISDDIFQLLFGVLKQGGKRNVS